MASDFAMSAKARAMYSGHLSSQNYATMLELDSVSAIGGYLKNQTRYSSVLSGVNEESIHRDFLEQKIRSLAMKEFVSLMRYVKKEKNHFYQFYLKELEINQLIFVLHAIESNTTHHYGKFMNEINHLMVFDVDALMVCTTYDQVLKVVSGTEYRDVLSLLSAEKVDLSQAEDNLQEHYNQSILKLIQAEGDKELLNAFNMQLELENIVLIYRMKKYFDVKPQDLGARLQGPHRHISRKKIEDWVDHYSGAEILEDLKHSYYGQFVDFDSKHHIEYYFDMIRYKEFRSILRLSSNTDLILFAYMMLVSLEIKNIIDVIEGVRYKITTHEIEQLLIY